MTPHWYFLVAWTDLASGLRSQTRFLWEASAQAYAAGLREAGFWSVTVRPVRVRVNQAPRAGCSLGPDPADPKRIIVCSDGGSLSCKK